jgi:outer membrane protein TolC
MVLVALAAWPAPATSQDVLTLDEAMARARTATPGARAVDAAVREADERVRQARAGYLPRIDVSGGVQRGNGPVFVFSSLLAQRRFTAANFAIEELNEPAALTNVRTAVLLDQPLFDAGLTRLRVSQAQIGQEIAAADGSRSTQDRAVAAAAAFIRVLQLESSTRATRAAVEAAESDLERARARRDVGLVTDADVLAVEVHLADVRQRAIAADGDLAVSRITLSEAIGAAPDASFRLQPPLAPPDRSSAGALVSQAIASRPELEGARLRGRLAQQVRRTAQAAFLPQVGVQGGWEWNGDSFPDQRSSWMVGAEVRLNVFNGFRDRGAVAEARYAEARAGAEAEAVARRIDVEVRTALARLEAARARAEAGRAALTQSRESQRIVRDRYEGGLATITDVLRAAEAALDAESRATSAEMDVILEGVLVERAIGSL